MKFTFIISLACALLVACKNKPAKEMTVSATKDQPEMASHTEKNQPAGDGIVGYWKLKLEAYDDDGNKVLDDAERKKGIKNNYTYRFKSDGSCQIQGIYKGRYEEKTEGDKKMLYVYRNRILGEEDDDPPPDVYRIISMSKNELVLLEDLGNLAFWVFERAG